MINKYQFNIKPKRIIFGTLLIILTNKIFFYVIELKNCNERGGIIDVRP